MADVNYNEWRTALGLPQDDPAALSTEELATMLGLSIRAMNARLKKAIAAGVVYTTTKRTTTRNNQHRCTPAYGLKKGFKPADLLAEKSGPKPPGRVRSKH